MITPTIGPVELDLCDVAGATVVLALADEDDGEPEEVFPPAP
jgi:hypothetical protein